VSGLFVFLVLIPAGAHRDRGVDAAVRLAFAAPARA